MCIQLSNSVDMLFTAPQGQTGSRLVRLGRKPSDLEIAVTNVYFTSPPTIPGRAASAFIIEAGTAAAKQPASKDAIIRLFIVNPPIKPIMFICCSGLHNQSLC